MHTSYKMNWRKVAGTITVATFALFALMGCKKDNTEEKTTLTINPTSISFNDAGASSRTVNITTNAKEGQLTAVSNVAWAKATIRGTKTMNVEVTANPSEEARQGIITVQTSDGLTATLSVSQVGLNPTLNVDRNTLVRQCGRPDSDCNRNQQHRMGCRMRRRLDRCRFERGR